MKKKQTFIEGTAPPSIPDLDALADMYTEHRIARMELLRKEMDTRDLLHAKMKEKGLKVYEYGDSVVEVMSSERVKVRKAEYGEKDKGEEEIGE